MIIIMIITHFTNYNIIMMCMAGKCETPQFLTNFNSLFNEHNGSLSCNDGYYPPATLNCQCEHGRWIILPDEVKCVSYSNQQG